MKWDISITKIQPCEGIHNTGQHFDLLFEYIERF